MTTISSLESPPPARRNMLSLMPTPSVTPISSPLNLRGARSLRSSLTLSFTVYL